MVIDMNESQVRTLEQVRQVLQGTQALQFRRPDDEAGRYGWIDAVLRRFAYRSLGRADRGLLRAYVQRFSGYSRAQVTRLVGRWVAGRPLVEQYCAPAQAFARRYTAADVVLLAEVDRAMDTLSGPATVCVLRRQRDVFGDARFARLGSISVAHLYNLRASERYRAQRVVTTKTRPTQAVTIGTRKAPAPDGRPGFIRIDSVHQGDQDGTKGLYHINAVDCVTQWQVVATVQTISEAHLLPVIEQMLAQFPFLILGFHADNGSEYVNHQVARMLDKLRIEFTRSRPRHSNDNGLAETKNGAVVRKIFGYAHIPQQHAARFVFQTRRQKAQLLRIMKAVTAPPREVVINRQQAAEQPRAGEAAPVVRHHETHRLHQPRRFVEQALTFAHRIAGQAPLALGDVTQTAVDHFRRST